MTPAVLLILFRREDTTRRVFEAIRQARPERLFLAADGPRPDRPGEAQACEATRKVVDAVDWPCRVERLYRDKNVGCRIGISEAITWFLDQAGEGIILEDDCLPSPDFFRFAAEGLDRYRHDERVMHISGSSFRGGRRFSTDSYTFSRYNHGWGWATWKRAWDRMDLEMAGLERFLVAADQTRFWDSSKERRYWSKVFRGARDLKVDAWDYQWKYTLWKEGGLALYPEANLVTNLGFGAGATNTTNDGGGKGQRPWERLGEISHPAFILRHRPADRANFLAMYWGTPLERWRARTRKALRLLGGR